MDQHSAQSGTDSQISIQISMSAEYQNQGWTVRIGLAGGAEWSQRLDKNRKKLSSVRAS
jgi:hypothetical protein